MKRLTDHLSKKYKNQKNNTQVFDQSRILNTQRQASQFYNETIDWGSSTKKNKRIKKITLKFLTNHEFLKYRKTSVKILQWKQFNCDKLSSWSRQAIICHDRYILETHKIKSNVIQKATM